jgi:hypothetical protein
MATAEPRGISEEKGDKLSAPIGAEEVFEPLVLLSAAAQ